ncbi:hypothetical protein ACHAXH_003858 [Discostella pseudostelligera]
MKLSITLSLAALLSSASAFSPSGFSSRSAAITSTALPVKTGAGGQPAKSKEEDLELTTQIILDYVNAQNAEDGTVDDDDE